MSTRVQGPTNADGGRPGRSPRTLRKQQPLSSFGGECLSGCTTHSHIGFKTARAQSTQRADLAREEKKSMRKLLPVCLVGILLLLSVVLLNELRPTEPSPAFAQDLTSTTINPAD